MCLLKTSRQFGITNEGKKPFFPKCQFNTGNDLGLSMAELEK